jgi:hypothetical protein
MTKLQLLVVVGQRVLDEANWTKRFTRNIRSKSYESKCLKIKGKLQLTIGFYVLHPEPFDISLDLMFLVNLLVQFASSKIVWPFWEAFFKDLTLTLWVFHLKAHKNSVFCLSELTNSFKRLKNSLFMAIFILQISISDKSRNR